MAVLAGLVVAFAGLWFRHAVYLERSAPAVQTDVIIPKGSTFAQITAILHRDGVITDPLAFRILARIRAVEASARAGEFRFAPHQSSDEVLRHLIEGGAEIAVWVTIPEGYTAKEIAKVLADRDLGSAAAYTREFLETSTRIEGYGTKNLEGFLFPSTYLIPRHASPQAAAAIMLEQFRKELPAGAAARARRLGITLPQVVTLASLVEREAKSDDERALMAGVYYNRLRRNMPLQVDATIEYALPEHKSELSRSDLALDSPYNTYRYAGLPPTPIASPGKPSLEAAFHPERSDYLYYVYKGNGRHAFAKTLAEHNANVARYLR